MAVIQLTRLREPGFDNSKFHPRYLNAFLDEFASMWQEIDIPKERTRVQDISMAVASAVDMINYTKNRMFGFFWPLEKHVLYLTDITPDTHLVSDLGLKKKHFSILGLRINDRARQVNPAYVSLVGPDDYSKMYRKDPSVRDCIDHAVKSSLS